MIADGGMVLLAGGLCDLADGDAIHPALREQREGGGLQLFGGGAGRDHGAIHSLTGVCVKRIIHVDKSGRIAWSRVWTLAR